jgi:DNA-binding MarR family transcriptional regulator
MFEHVLYSGIVREQHRPGSGAGQTPVLNLKNRFMRIETAIKQQSFRNENHRAVVNLLYTFNTVSNAIQHILNQEGLTMQQFNVLRILRGRHPEPATNTLIRDRMLDKNSDVTRIIDRLVKTGLVERTLCRGDRRRVDIVITGKGLEALKRIDKRNDEMDAIVGNLSEKEVGQLNSLLDKLRDGLE